MTAVAEATGPLPPLSDAIITAVSRLVDDRDNRRDPSHSDLTSHIRRAGLATADLTTPAGKEKRIRAVLGWAIQNDETAGRAFVGYVVAEIRGCRGFRAESVNYVGADAIENARGAFRSEGFASPSTGSCCRSRSMGSRVATLLTCFGHTLAERFEAPTTTRWSSERARISLRRRQLTF